MTPKNQKILNQVINYIAENEFKFSQIDEQPKLLIEYENGGGYEWQIVAEVEEGITRAKIVFYSIIPDYISLSKGYFDKVGEFFNRINYRQIKIGSFELDYNSGFAHCKTSIKINPTLHNTEAIDDLFYENIRLMNKYIGGIKAVAEGKLDPEEAQIRGRIDHPVWE